VRRGKRGEGRKEGFGRHPITAFMAVCICICDYGVVKPRALWKLESTLHADEVQHNEALANGTINRKFQKLICIECAQYNLK